MNRMIDLNLLRILTQCQQNWRAYIECKKALIDVSTFTKDDIDKSHPLSKMMLTDLAKTLEFYLPKIQEIVKSFNQKDRSPQYNKIYLESFFYGHLIDEVEGFGMDVNHHIEHAKFKAREIDIYDVGGGLCYWSDLITKQYPNAVYVKHVIEKQEVIDILYSKDMKDKWPHIKEYVSHGPHWLDYEHMVMGKSSIVVVAQFLHLFTLEEAVHLVVNMFKKAIDIRNQGGSVLFLFIEPMISDNYLPMFGFRMDEQMKIMKGIKSCHNTIIAHIDRLSSNATIMDALALQLEQRIAGRVTGGYAVLPVIVDKNFTINPILKHELERSVQ